MTLMLPGSTTGTDTDNADIPLLTLRFAVPTPPKHLVDRPRLSELLDQTTDVPLTLVSAPAGSGKTALVASWVAQRSRVHDTAWISFDDHAEVPPERFWSDVLDGVWGHVGPERARERSPERSTDRSSKARPDLVTEVATEVARLDQPLTLVLDGCELLDADLAADLDFVLRHSDQRLHVVLLTRVDPVLPLHRYRLEETVLELRLSDLAFSEEETRQLLELSGVELMPASLGALTTRTRGWVAGLRFATMVLSRCEDPDDAVRQLAGDRGNIAEYLMAEVLQTQPEDVRTLLMHTSVVDVLEPGLIEELGGPGAPRMLDALARANVLVETITDRPGWYRYHPFLRDLLRAELAAHAPTQRVRLHLKAAGWFAQRGSLATAVELASDAGAWAKASRLVVEELALAKLLLGDESDEVARRLKRLPSSAHDPDSAVVRAALAAAEGDVDTCAEELASARAASAGTSAHGRSVELAAGLVDAIRAGLADDPAAPDLADQALRDLRSHRVAGQATHVELVALVEVAKGEWVLRHGAMGEARTALSAGLRAARTAGSDSLMARSLAGLAVVAVLAGELRRAGDLAAEAVTRVARPTVPAQGRAPLGEAELALAWVSAERYDLPATDEHLRSGARSRPRYDDHLRDTLSALVRSRLLRARGDTDGAVELVERTLARIAPEWLHHLLEVEGAAIRLGGGDAQAAVLIIDGLDDTGSADDLLALGAARLALGDQAAAQDAVSSLLDLREGSPPTIQVRTGILEAAYEIERRQPRRAKVALLRCLRDAAPERLRRPFLEAPSSVRELLAADPELIQHSSWLRPSTGPRQRVVPLQRTRPPDEPPPDQVIEPLTAKELEVLGHLSELLSTEEIASAMFVSVNTIRTHVRSILRKLAVSRRNEAVRRGRALGLVAS